MKKIGILHLLLLIVGSLLCFAGSFYFALQKAIATAKANLPPPAPAPVVAAAVPDVRKEESSQEPSVQRWVVPQKVAEELNTWRHELEEKEKKLLAQDADILRRNNLLNAEREALGKERARLSEMQKDIEERLILVSKADTANLEQVSTLYSNMKPVESAGIMRQLSDEQNAKLLGIMKPTKSAKILETWSRTFPDDRERLAHISDAMRVIIKTDDQPQVSLNNPAQ